ncbi:putative inositol phosphatidylinositol phosphatase [Trypanosoma grayi]|uniref:putative inositol phosphatidylinositol phosphatase n=1 Tax=Trypanosoma grayi TaxID=71804 RepID=UPI0004F47F5B|nr:putative inositol phosphatidylinositol phosphatase [Trypanosoma grayi]KEG10738.1 putative inositol phosphatidylinositol phosphatase [Trypanosoma grayi]
MIPGLPAAFDVECNRMEDVFSYIRNSAVGSDGAVFTPEEAWVQRELQYYEELYTEQKDLTVCLVTFNVACKKPPSNLASFVSLAMPKGNNDSSSGSSTSNREVDLIMVSLQEVDMSASAMLKEETEAATPWITGLHAAVGADSQRVSNLPYYAFPPKQLVGLLLCVYLRRPLLPYVQEMSVMTVATGALGSMGNKGAVGLHLVLHRTSICLINVHLAAGQNNLVKRNDDASNIFMGMDFNAQKRQMLITNLQGGSVPSEVLYQHPELLPHDHDIIVVSGDLNYRIKLGYDAAVELALRCDTARLLEHDEFMAELSNPHSPWLGFVDLTPTFPPTYRFDVGTGIYDTSEKQRVPSYTDRIVIWTKRKAHQQLIHVERLQALMDVCSSDHKPVQALLRLPILCEVEDKKKAVRQSLRKRIEQAGLDRTASAKTTIEPVSLDFGAQQFYDCGARQVLNITNAGECVALVRTFRQCNNDVSEGAWLRVFPANFSILPGETKEVVVECQLNPRCMRWMSLWRPFEARGRLSLSSMLVVFVYQGPVHLVECTCTLKPSVFGNSLENIALLGNEVCVTAYATSGDLEKLSKVMRPQLPKELWFLCEAIYARGAREPNLFTENSSTETCAAIMHRLDTCCEPLPDDYDVQCIATCFITFLQSLQEPVVPFALYGAALAAGRAKGKAPLMFVQQQLPPLHANVWIYVCALLNFLLRPVNARSNELTPRFLAKLFSTVMLVRPGVLLHTSSERKVGSYQGIATGTQGGVASQTLRQQLQQQAEDAMSLIEYFLVPPPEALS